jgi:predicted acylesterase/phospholipase RssA
MTLITLIKMTTAIPGILPPVRYHDDLYVDGALMDNLPIRVLDISKPLLVIIVGRTPHSYHPTNKLVSFFYFFSILIKLLYRNNDIDIIENCGNRNIKQVMIETNVSVTSFNVTKDEKFGLILAGKLAAESYLASESESD